MKILISGAGIAGPTLAYWLKHYGFEPTIIETAPKLRTDGYIIDFWGVGYDIAEKMGLLKDITDKGYFVNEVRTVNSGGQKIAGFSADVFNRLTKGRYISLPRGDLAAAIYHSLDNKVETIFDDTIEKIDQNNDTVQVSFKNSKPREFDLVIGADGLHSNVRNLVFGPQQNFEKYLGYKVAAFESKGYTPRNELVYMMYTELGQQVARFSMRGDRTLFLFVFADEEKDNSAAPHIDSHKALLHKRFGNSGWECPEILDALDKCDDLYFDRVSQIRMTENNGSWSKGRVSLLGDAAFCPSLLAGQGSALAMIAAYILAGELYKSKGNYAEAFDNYQKLFGPFVAKKQKAAVSFAGAFAPKTKVGLFLRNQIMKMLNINWIADMALGRDLVDDIILPDYTINKLG